MVDELLSEVLVDGAEVTLGEQDAQARLIDLADSASALIHLMTDQPPSSGTAEDKRVRPLGGITDSSEFTSQGIFKALACG